MSRVLLTLFLLQAAIQTSPPSTQPTPTNATPTNASPSSPFADPASVTFSTDVGLLLVAVKPTAIADYEAAIVALQDALAKATDADMRELAKGWRVFKANEPDAKTNALYVHLLQPTKAGADYRPSILLDKLLSGAPAELLAKYRDSFAIPPTKLALAEFANMTVAPVPKPTNTSPDAPLDPKKPGNASPGNASPPMPPVKPPAR